MIHFVHKRHHILAACIGSIIALCMGFFITDDSKASNDVNMSITNTPFPSIVEPGDEVVYLYYYQNNSNVPASNIQITMTPDTNTTIVGSNKTYVDNGGTYTWSGLTGQYGFILVEMEVNENFIGTLSNTVEVSSAEYDTQTSNNTAISEVVVEENSENTSSSDIAVQIDTDNDMAQAGSTQEYTITVTNNGPDDAEQVLLVNTLSDGLTFVSSNPVADVQSLATGNAWYIENIPAGQSQIVQIVAAISSLVETDDVLYHYVSTTSDNSDDDTENNIATHELVIEQSDETTTPNTPSTVGGGAAGGASGGGAAGGSAGSETTPLSTITSQTGKNNNTGTTQSGVVVSQEVQYELFDTPQTTATPTSLDASATCMDNAQTVYQYAKSIGITTQNTLAAARMCDGLLRMELAKMMSNFAIQVLGRTPDVTRTCVFNDMKDQSQEMQEYATLACQLGIMGLDATGKPVQKFNPLGVVDRAQFATVFSRVLWGDKYNGDTQDRYKPHLYALYQADVMKNINDPFMRELRGYVMLMMQRVDENNIGQ